MFSLALTPKNWELLDNCNTLRLYCVTVYVYSKLTFLRISTIYLISTQFRSEHNYLHSLKFICLNEEAFASLILQSDSKFLDGSIHLITATLNIIFYDHFVHNR